LQENYGKKSSECEAKVKEIYNQIDITSKYEQYEKESFEQVNRLTETIPEDSPLKKEVFQAFMAKIYKRKF
jgi:farnesyl diphosphate synthase